MIYTLGDISGAHMNPAVTISFWIANRFKRNEIIPYIISQLTGAFIASASLRLMFPNNNLLGSTIPSGGNMQSFILELILTFILMFVILNVSTGSKEKGITAGIAIASVVGLEAMFAGPICGASMNPARSIAPAILSGNIQSLWIYILAPVIGGLMAVFVFNVLKEKQGSQ
jgi:aquaporin Z